VAAVSGVRAPASAPSSAVAEGRTEWLQMRTSNNLLPWRSFFFTMLRQTSGTVNVGALRRLGVFAMVESSL
jgi:hypothetical protein